MSLLVILLFAVALVSVLYPKHIHPVLCLALLWLVPIYALVYFVEWHKIELLLACFYASAGIVIGGVLFFTGSFLLVENPLYYFKQSVVGVGHNLRSSLADIVYKVGLVGCKELIWRVFLIGALTQFMPVWLSIIIAAVLFWLLNKENWPLSDHSIEYFQFSLALTMLYAYSGSFVLVWCAHLIRVILVQSASASESEQNP